MFHTLFCRDAQSSKETSHHIKKRRASAKKGSERVAHGLSTKPHNQQRRMLTHLKLMPDIIQRFRIAVQGGELSRFCVFVQDRNGDVYGDSSADLQHWLTEKSGLLQTIVDSDNGKFRSMSNDKARMQDLQNRYPTCASALKLLNVTKLRKLLRELDWRAVSRALTKNKWPAHMSQFRDKQDQYAKSLGTVTVADHDEGNDLDTDTSAQGKQRERDDQGRYLHKPMEYEQLFSIQAWHVPDSSTTASTQLITMKELLSKAPNIMTVAQLVAAVGLVMEYHNPGQLHCYAPREHAHSFFMCIH